MKRNENFPHTNIKMSGKRKLGAKKDEGKGMRKTKDDEAKVTRRARSKKPDAEKKTLRSLRPTALVKKHADIKLSAMQQKVVDSVRAGKNVFFSGVAGTGKSFLLDYLIEYVLPKEGTYVTASTGIAAVNISGTTLHSFAGIGLGKEPKEVLAKKVIDLKPLRDKWRSAKTLIVDEISMIDGVLFDKIEYVARMARGSHKPFGGLRVILSGDFLQLPPVEKIDGVTHFCFMAESWPRVINEIVILDKVFRQKSDALVDALNEIRLGKVTPSTTAMFTACVGRDLKCDDGVEPTVLFPLKVEVKEINDKKLAALAGAAKVFEWAEAGNPKVLESLKKNFNGTQSLCLKVGTQVMLIKNLNPMGGLVNGSRGVVIGFEPVGGVEEEDEKDEKDSEESGSEAEEGALGADDEVDEDEEDEEEKGKSVDKTLYPVVQFANGGPRLLIIPEKWETKVQGKTIARITQIPLIHGWSLTIHKCQGMTLDYVELSMRCIFEYAQAYVAFSRVRSIEGLRLVDFNPMVIRAHPKAKEFYERIGGVPPPSPPATGALVLASSSSVLGSSSSSSSSSAGGYGAGTAPPAKK